MSSNRRDFLKKAGLGALGLGFGVGTLTVPSFAEPTEGSGDLGDYGEFLRKNEKAFLIPEVPKAEDHNTTEDNVLGPFYRAGAPFRAKVSPTLSDGMPLLVKGRVWGQDSKAPLKFAVIDVWQASHYGRYDNDDPDAPPNKNFFLYRARVLCDETGYYEYETIHPAQYAGRPSHIHYLVRAPGYQSLITQLYFKGDDKNDKDPFVKKSLIVAMETLNRGKAKMETGNFDIVLAPANAAKKMLVITKITPGFSAEKAGLKVGDAILEYNGQSLAEKSELSLQLMIAGHLSEVPAKILRDKKVLEMPLKPGRLGVDVESKNRE